MRGFFMPPTAAQTSISRHNRGMASLLRELKRRNVFRVAAAYALVAWILIEAGSVLLPEFGAPDWFFKVYILIVFAGFVLALIIAWIFEITPDGVKLEKDVDRRNYVPPSRGPLNFVLIGLLLVALVVSVSFNITGVRETGIDGIGNDSYSSVAVLPFENRSADPENGFFADGIHDDLLSRLAGIESLHVISRTSVDEYRDTTKNAVTIAEELGVSTIVEGAVQRSGNQVRVTVSLVDAINNTQLWSNTYDRDAGLQSVFELQSEISSAITSSLRAALTPEERERMANIPTENIEALRLFVEGTINLNQRRFDTLVLAQQQFAEAIDLDPRYAKAHAALAETVMVLYINHQAISPGEARRAASDAVATALQLDAANAQAYAVRGLIESNRWQQTRVGDGNDRAAEDFRRALDINPNYANAYVWFSTLREHEGDVEAAVRLLGTALAKDPLNRTPFINLPGLHSLRGDNDAATALLLKAMEFFPGWELPYRNLAQHLQKLGRLDEAMAWSLQHANISGDPLAGGNAIGMHRLFGNHDALAAFMANFPPDHPAVPIGLGYQKFIEGDYEATIKAFANVEEDALGANGIVNPLLVRASIRLGEFELARDILLRSNPRFSADELRIVDRFNLGEAVMLAYVEQQLGNNAAANRLLDEALLETNQLPRVGFAGHGIRDVQILALQGRIPAALDRLSEAIDEGFNSEIAFDHWSVDEDPILAPLRDEPRFDQLRAAMAARIDVLRASVMEAETNDTWSELRAKTAASLSVAAR